MSKIKKMFSVLLTVVMVFTTILSTGMIAYASMLPLKEVKAYLILNGKTNEELSSMKVDDILDMLMDSDGNQITSIPNNATTVWKYAKTEDSGVEEYHKYSIGKNEVMDLSVDDDIKTYTMELIIGSTNQLDSNNVRFIVKVYISNIIQENFGFELYLQDSDGNRNKVNPEREVSGYNTQLSFIGNIEVHEYIVPKPENGSQYYLNVTSEASENPTIRVEVFDFWQYCFSGGKTEPITNTVLNQKMQEDGTGLKIDYGVANMFAIVAFDSDNKIIGQHFVGFTAVNDTSYIDGGLYQKQGDQLVDAVLLRADSIGFEDIDSIFAADGIREICLMLKEGYKLDSELYCVLNAHGKTYGDNANSYVVKAVEGHYNTLEAASACADIKDQLIPADKTSPSRGYRGNYDYEHGGVPFTIFFDDGNVWKLIVLAMEYNPKFDPNYIKSFTDMPIIGEADPWFRITGAKNIEGNDLDTYVVENGKNINMDTLYGYGYQTIFINDKNADLSKLKPTFYVANEERVLPRVGTEQQSGVSVQDFSDGSVIYSNIIIDEDGTRHTKNYDINFVQKVSGAKLFVNGPDERTIFLDEYFEEKHDILVANIGDKELTGIKAELIDAKNVKIDDYWSIGGENNDTLAPFDITKSDSKYGELHNLAKVRLVPDGNKGGEISGTLRITADGGQCVEIKLLGRAKNPEIITDKLDDAVKYVPYSYLVATNNMNDWNKVTFKLTGELPDGLSFDESTGEIYGVAQQAGTFKFKVTANYSRSDYFEPSEKSFTLTVKENTDDNVFYASDEGYEIKQAIGIDENENHNYVIDSFDDQVFTSYGEIDEFVALWLNGVKLEQGKDYTAEHGSTKITVMGQTLENNANVNSSNTIAMEFRQNDGDNNELKRTAQNFTVDIPATDKAVDNVIALIDKIPTSPELSDKAKVEAARKAYDSLNANQKQAVTNYSRLTNAEKRIAVLEAEKKQLEEDIAAANKVIALINNLPKQISLDSKDEVVNARNEFNKLTATQKGYVTNLDRLVQAEAVIATLEKDKAEHDKNVAAANKVNDLINAIPSNITLADRAKVTEARNAYNKLTSEQKKYVEDYDKLVKSENKILELEAEQRKEEAEKAEINAVISMINRIPDNITLEDKQTVESARNAYEKLSSDQKKQVVNYNDLLKAEESIKSLEKLAEADEADKKAATEVMSIIDALPDEITLSDKPAVVQAREAYENLSNKQKKMVANYADLENAEKMIETLEAYEESNKKDIEAANAVIEMISNLPAEITVNDKSVVTEARNAYNNLTDDQKKIVTNYNDLEAAEIALAEAELEEHKKNEVKGYITIICALTDAQGNPMKDYIVEIHSEVMTSTTDINGYCRFVGVEIGEHTIIIKDKNNNIIAQQKVVFTADGETSLDQYNINTDDGETYTLKLCVDNGKISISNVTKGDKTPEIPKEDPNEEYDNYIEISDDTKKPENKIDEETGKIIANPKTGDKSDITLWYILLAVSSTSLIALFVFNKKRSNSENAE